MERAERRETPLRFFCFMERVPLPIKVVLSKQGKSGMMREKSSGKEEKKQLRKIFQKK